MEVAIRRQSLFLLLEERESRAERVRMCSCCFKTQFGNFKTEWISSEICLLPLLELKKGETLPKLADLLINELFVVVDEGESFHKGGKCAAILSQLNTPTVNEFITVYREHHK